MPNTGLPGLPGAALPAPITSNSPSNSSLPAPIAPLPAPIGSFSASSATLPMPIPRPAPLAAPIAIPQSTIDRPQLASPPGAPAPGSFKGAAPAMRVRPVMRRANTADLVNSVAAPYQPRLRALFNEIENEFAQMYEENLELRRRLDKYERDLDDDGDDFDHAARSRKIGASSNAHSASLPVLPRHTRLLRPNWSPTRRFTGHHDSVWEVTVSPMRSNCIGTASADRSARLWITSQSNYIYNYAGHKGSVNSIRFHPTEARACTASGDRTVHVWNIPPVVTKMVDAAATSPEPSHRHDNDGAAGGNEFTNLTGKVPQARLASHMDVVSCADWLSGGSKIVSGGWDKALMLWDMQQPNTPISTFLGHDARINHLAVHHTDDIIATASKDGTFRLTDTRKQGGAADVVKAHGANITSVAFSRTDAFVLTSSEDRTVKVWSLKNLRMPVSVIRQDAGVNRISISPVGNMIAAPLVDGCIRIFDVSGGRLIKLPRAVMGHRKAVSSTAWARDDSSLFSSGFGEEMVRWDPSWIQEDKVEK